MAGKVEFEGRWALVTGASAGIGEAFARALAARGSNLVIVARRRERLEQLAQRLATRVEVIACDLEAPSAARVLYEEVQRRNLVIDHLVNNAGFGGGGRFERQASDLQARMIGLNCTTLTELTRHFLPHMVEQNHGGVIQLASLASFVPTPYMAVYGATKAYVLSLTTALAEELRGKNVRMLAVCPGPVPTEFQARAGYSAVSDAKAAVVSAPEVARLALRAYERGRHVIVPGAKTAFAAFASRFGSPALNARAAAIAMKRAGRDKLGD